MQVVDVGQSATFVCAVSGSPRSSVVWYKDGALLVNTADHPSDDGNDDVERVTLSADGRQLSVNGVLRQDAGVYQCLVDNADDSHQSAGRLIIGGNF